MGCSTPGFPVHHQLQELGQTHAHQIGNAIQPSHPLLSPSLPVFNLSQHQGLFLWSYHACMLGWLGHIQLCATLWTATCQAHLSMGFSRQEYYGGFLCPPQGIFPTHGLNSHFLHLPALAREFFTTSTTWEALILPYDPPIVLPGIHPKELKIYVHIKTYTQIL